MKNKLKLLIAVVLSLTMVMGTCLTSFSATVVMKNPNSLGVQLIGDTLIIQEDHYNFNVTGKALMLQCPGVTDILPNNGLKTVDIQFDGNMYSGITEMLIVSTPGKNSKIRLDEGSMIITGVTTPEQVQKVKTAIMNQPDTLVELKSVLTGASQDLSVTKNYIVGKRNEVLNESGARVSKKEFQGAVDLIADVEVAQVIVEGSKSEASESTSSESTSSESTSSESTSLENTSSESTSSEEKKDTPTPNPSPAPVCKHEKGYACYSNLTHKCRICKMEFDHVFTSNDESHSCEKCNEQDIPHTYNDGVCSVCKHVCTHDGATTGTCEYCKKSLGTPSCQVDHDTLCPGQICECGEHGSGKHNFLMGKCSYCQENCPECDNDSSMMLIGTYCEVCGLQGTGALPCQLDHDALCPGQTCECGASGTGNHVWDETNVDTCSICQTVCSHPNGYEIYFERYTGHKCKDCNFIEDCIFSNGFCSLCNRPCYICDGEGLEIDRPCPICSKIKPYECPFGVDHSLWCSGWSCPECYKPGTGTDLDCHIWFEGECSDCYMVCPECQGDSSNIPTGSACWRCQLEGTGE